MMIEEVAIDQLASAVYGVNVANGWDCVEPEHFHGEEKFLIPNKLALAHSELSEALEAYRKGDLDNFMEELADTIIRVLDLAHPFDDSQGNSIGRILMDKLEKNRNRGHRHGGKRV